MEIHLLIPVAGLWMLINAIQEIEIKSNTTFSKEISIRENDVILVNLVKRLRKRRNHPCKMHHKNTGLRYGAEVAQLYASDPVCSVLRPGKELKAFEKVFLKPGEIKTIELTIKVADLAFYDEVKKDWNVEAGEFVLHIGNSSNNILEKMRISVQ